MENRDTAEWNGAGDYLDRINLSLQLAGQAALSLDVYQWLHALKLFYREISSMMKDEERERLYQESIELSTKVNEFLQLKNNVKLKYKIGVDYKLIESLEHFEIELRKIFKESGLQLKLSDDASRALK